MPNCLGLKDTGRGLDQQRRNLIYNEEETARNGLLALFLEENTGQERKNYLCFYAASPGGKLKSRLENNYLEKIHQKPPHGKQLDTNIFFFSIVDK